MKILVIGLDCAAPELLFTDERLTNIRRLMELGCYGSLESIIPPITVPAWMCMSTSQDPGSLGIYGFRNRLDYSYAGLGFANSKSIREIAIWDQVAREGKRSIIVGVPPSYPPRKVNGICVGCFLTPDPTTDIFTYPPEITDEINKNLGNYMVDVKGFRTNAKDWLINQIYSMSRKQFDLVRHLLKTQEWDYLHFVEIGLDRLQHGFWQFHDPQHVLYEPNNPYPEVIRDYYIYLDEQIGTVLELIDDDTVVLVVSDHGAQRLDGGYCVNEWLVREGLLVLEEYPSEITTFAKLKVDWGKTKVWSEGGYYARVFLNVKGRELNGIIEKSDYESFRDEIKAIFEATQDDQGKSLGTLVFKPEEIYRTVNNIAPDLIVHFGSLYWRSIGGVGYPSIHTQENDTGPDGCNHSQFGSFILASSNNPFQGVIKNMHILNIAPTLLELGSYDLPSSMQGMSIVDGMNVKAQSSNQHRDTDEEIIRERLSGLGYIE